MTKEIKGMEEIVDIKRVIPNDYNPNEQSNFIYLREKRSIEKFGFVMPILVREVGDKLIIVDGEHRQSAMRELHAEGVEIFTTPDHSAITKGKINVKNLGVISDAAARQLTI